MLANFIGISCISILVMAACCLLSYEILRFIWNLLPRLHFTPRLRVLAIIVPIFAAHIISIWIYALSYFLVANYLSMGEVTGAGHTTGLSYESFVNYLYFSAATYTSLGFGDIVPTGDLRMLTAAEVLNGLVMIAWTASFTYLTMEKFWTLHDHGKK
jgi:Na+-driven multidrug efflux pump